MIVVIKNHEYSYDMRNLATIFFPYENIKLCDGLQDGEDEIVVITELDEEKITVSARVYDKCKTESINIAEAPDVQTALAVLFYNIMSEILGIKPPWGILYGVRPARLVHRLSDDYGEDGAMDILKNKYLVTESKASLALDVMRRENKIIALSERKSFSLYISIPFCPSRCSYCSFVSHSIENTVKLIEPYVDLLLKEIEETGKVARELGLRLESVYFGGGTPTTLSAKNLSRIFAAIENNFDLSTLREYTVEAGRPDTVTKEKLHALKAAGVSRISINPQTFNDEVLKEIGRKHTSAQTVEAYELARKCGFDNINMDFIAGLPKDTEESFVNSIDAAVNMGAESVTVHTLALKSGAYMATREAVFDVTDKITTAKMVDYSNKKLAESGYYPYYMYRQSKSLGNLENVGWCREGLDCLYNVFMMDETHTVLSVGAGAVIKLKSQPTGKIERIYNYKYPYEYIDKFDDILQRKQRIKDFFNEYTL